MELGYEIEDLPQSELILETSTVGKVCSQTQFESYFSLTPFNVLASANPQVVAKTVRDLNCHSKIFNYMGFEPSWENKINIHVGGAYGDKESALARFVKTFNF